MGKWLTFGQCRRDLSGDSIETQIGFQQFHNLGTRFSTRGNMVHLPSTCFSYSAQLNLMKRNVNTYPGCACDIPGVVYSYSFDPYPGSTLFPPQQELKSYLQRSADKFGVTSHIVFSTWFHTAKYDEKTSSWTLTLKNLITDTEFEEVVDIFILAIGGL